MAGVGCSQRSTDPAAETVNAAAAAPAASSAPVTPEPAPSAGLGTTEINPRLLRRFQPLPQVFEDEKNPRTPAKVDLGRMLYFDKRLSKDGEQSCNSCHDLANYGVDHQPFSMGHGKVRGLRNAPTVYDAAGFFTQFWDGRAPNVEEQSKGPLVNPIEMAMTDGAHVASTLKAVPGYADAFRRAFPGDADPITFDNVGRAIGAFERGLVTPSRWDDYLRGNPNALTPAEKEGFKTFLNVGCMVCHTGALLGGSMFERAGAAEPWPNQKDRGRQQVTKASADGMLFKVPTLRNVAKTAPYFHDASAATLPEAVQMMGRYQLGMELTPEEIAGIVTWLNALTGEVPTAYVAEPTLPPSH